MYTPGLPCAYSSGARYLPYRRRRSPMEEKQPQDAENNMEGMDARLLRVSEHLRVVSAAGCPLLGQWDALQYDEPETRIAKARQLVHSLNDFFERFPPMEGPMSDVGYASDAYALLVDMPQSEERSAFKALLFDTVDLFDRLEAVLSECLMVVHAPKD